MKLKSKDQSWVEFNECLAQMLKILDDRDEMTSHDVWESGFAQGVRGARTQDMIHSLWREAIDLMCWLNGEQLLTADDFKKPLSSSHRGYKFHCHYYPPIRDKRNAEAREWMDQRNRGELIV